MQAMITAAICVACLFFPGGDYLVLPVVIASCFIGHWRNKRDQRLNRKP